MLIKKGLNFKFEVIKDRKVLFQSDILIDCQKFLADHSEGTLKYSPEYQGVFTPMALKRGGVYEGAKKL